MRVGALFCRPVPTNVGLDHYNVSGSNKRGHVSQALHSRTNTACRVQTTSNHHARPSGRKFHAMIAYCTVG